MTATPRTVPGDMLLLPVAPRSKDDRKLLVKGRYIPNKAYYDWRAAVRLWLTTLRLPMATGPVRLDAVYVRPNLRRADIENALSGFSDCATGILWKDDSDIHELHVSKQLDRSIPEPRLYFAVTPLEVE